MFLLNDGEGQPPCPRCGFELPPIPKPPPNFYRPWHLRGQGAVRDYVGSLGAEAHEWLLALYVDKNLDLLAVDTIAKGDISSCSVPFSRILVRGHRLGADGFILVHNHPSGDPTPSMEDVRATVRLSSVSRDCELPLLSHIVIAGDKLTTVGYW